MSSTAWPHHRFFAVLPQLIVIVAIAAVPGAGFAKGATWEKSTGSRATLNLSGDWKLSPLRFSKDRPAAPGEEAPEAGAVFDDSTWPAVVVPGDWFGVFWDRFKDQVPAEEPSFIDGWYRTSFQIPSSVNGRFLPQFDAVDYVASVDVNGKRVDVHMGTWSPFQFDITRHVRAGEANVLAVHVMMDVPNFGGGLEQARGYRARKILKFNLGGIHQPVPEANATAVATGAPQSVLSQANAIRRYGDDAVATHYVNQLLRHVLCEPPPQTTPAAMPPATN